MANILIVDDSKTSRKMIRNVIEQSGNTVIGEAVNGEEAVAKFKELHPDIVTMDITMPVKDGVSALKDIMAEDPNAKVVMVTAAGQKGKVKECVEVGAKDFLSKPFDKKEIQAVVDKVLNI